MLCSARLAAGQANAVACRAAVMARDVQRGIHAAAGQGFGRRRERGHAGAEGARRGFRIGLDVSFRAHALEAVDDDGPQDLVQGIGFRAHGYSFASVDEGVAGSTTLWRGLLSKMLVGDRS